MSSPATPTASPGLPPSPSKIALRGTPCPFTAADLDRFEDRYEKARRLASGDGNISPASRHSGTVSSPGDHDGACTSPGATTSGTGNNRLLLQPGLSKYDLQQDRIGKIVEKLLGDVPSLGRENRNTTGTGDDDENKFLLDHALCFVCPNPDHKSFLKSHPEGEKNSYVSLEKARDWYEKIFPSNDLELKSAFEKAFLKLPAVGNFGSPAGAGGGILSSSLVETGTSTTVDSTTEETSTLGGGPAATTQQTKIYPTTGGGAATHGHDHFSQNHLPPNKQLRRFANGGQGAPGVQFTQSKDRNSVSSSSGSPMKIVPFYMQCENPKEKCKDFLTLVRNTIVYLLVQKCEYTVCQHYSPDARYIYILIAADLTDLKKQAEARSVLTKVHWERVDPEAFEPHDRAYRPLIEHFMQAKDKDVLEAYKKMVGNFEANWQSVPPEIAFYHQTKLSRRQKVKGLKKEDITGTGVDAKPTLAGVTKALAGFLSPKKKKSQRASEDDLENNNDTASSSAESAAESSAQKPPAVVPAAIVKPPKIFTSSQQHQTDTSGATPTNNRKPLRDGTQFRSNSVLEFVIEKTALLSDDNKWQEVRKAYLLYLEYRARGLTSFRAMHEANRDLGLLKTNIELQNLWNRLGFNAGPLHVALPFTNQREHVPWSRFQVRNQQNELLETPFSAAERLKIMCNTIEKYLDLPDLICLHGGLFLQDYFPIDDLELKELSMVSYEEYLFRGDFVYSSLKSEPLIQSRYFVKAPPPGTGTASSPDGDGNIQKTGTSSSCSEQERLLRMTNRMKHNLTFKQLKQFEDSVSLMKNDLHLNRMKGLANFPWYQEFPKSAGGVVLQPGINFFSEEIVQNSVNGPGCFKFGFSGRGRKMVDGEEEQEKASTSLALSVKGDRRDGTVITGAAAEEDLQTDPFSDFLLRLRSGEMASLGFKWPGAFANYWSIAMEHEYYGQKIALYFLFARYMTVGLLVPVYFGILATIFQIVAGFYWTGYEEQRNCSAMIMLANACFLSVWSSNCVDGWVKVENTKLLQLHGVLPTIAQRHAASIVPVPRKRFRGQKIKSPISGDEGELYFASWIKKLRSMISNLVSLSAIAAVMVAVVLISALRIKIAKYCTIILFDYHYNYAQSLVGAINAVVILIFNYVYAIVALWLTQFENHRLYSSFLDSYAFKTAAFNFLNCYSSLIYYAFFMMALEDEKNQGEDVDPATARVLNYPSEAGPPAGTTSSFLQQGAYFFGGDWVEKVFDFFSSSRTPAVDVQQQVLETATSPSRRFLSAEDESICAHIEPSLIFGVTCAVGLTNRYLVSLIFVFAARNIIELAQPILMQWYRERVFKSGFKETEEEKKCEATGGVEQMTNVQNDHESSPSIVSLKQEKEQTTSAKDHDEDHTTSQSDPRKASKASSNSLLGAVKTKSSVDSANDDDEENGNNYAEQKQKQLSKEEITRQKLQFTLETAHRQTLQDPYGEREMAFDGSIEDFTEIAVMFGFLVLFSISCPLVAILSFLALVCEIFVDDWKIKYLVRRPVPVGAEFGIGIWTKVFRGIVYASIPFNACLLVVTAELYKFEGFLKHLTGEDPNPIAVWFLVAFFLGMVKIVVEAMLAPNDTESQEQVLSARLQLHVDKLTLPLKSKKSDLTSVEETTDFVVQPWPAA
ncbi:unnamed protein product [Amoebophrya sp. A120]|nr:unnamed protein product [Amoebophrya sp. A120]|eukprot:GSA120T00014924001.1